MTSLTLTVDYDDHPTEGTTSIAATMSLLWSGPPVDAALRFRKLPRTVVELLRQTEPVALELTGLAAPVTEFDDEYPISLSEGRQIFELRLAVVAETPGDEIRVARITVLVDNEQQAEKALVVTWQKGDSDQPSVPTVRTSNPAAGPQQ